MNSQKTEEKYEILETHDLNNEDVEDSSMEKTREYSAGDQNGKYSEYVRFSVFCLVAASIQIYLLDI